MRDILAPLVEAILGYQENEIFCNLLYDSNDYTIIALTLLFVPLLLMLLFYKFIDPILPQRSHWFAMLGAIAILVVLLSYLIILNGSMESCFADPAFCNMNAVPYYENLVTSIVMGVLSVVSSFIFSIGLKYISTNNKTNPF